MKLPDLHEFRQAAVLREQTSVCRVWTAKAAPPETERLLSARLSAICAQEIQGKSLEIGNLMQKK